MRASSYVYWLVSIPVCAAVVVVIGGSLACAPPRPIDEDLDKTNFDREPRYLGNTRVETFAGSGFLALSDGFGEEADIGAPAGVAFNEKTGNLYVADNYSHRIRRIQPDGLVETIAGDGPIGNGIGTYLDGPGGQARFDAPISVAVDGLGRIYVSDSGNNLIRRVEEKLDPVVPDDTRVITYAGIFYTTGERFLDGSGASARFDTPLGIAIDAAGTLYVTDRNNHRIRRVTVSDRVEQFPADDPRALDVDTYAGAGKPDNDNTFADGKAADALFAGPESVALDVFGNVYVADSFNRRIRKITPDGQVFTLAGTGERGTRDGPASEAKFNIPAGVAVDAEGNVFVSDVGDNSIRMIRNDGEVFTVAGNGFVERLVSYADGAGEDALFDAPWGMAFGPDGALYIADVGNGRVRRIFLE